jgi:hypothetical protein
MGRHSIASEIFDNESKIDFGVRDSVLTIDEVTPYPPLGSSIQLFEREPSPEEQEWCFGVREWLVFVCIVILSMMDSFNATSLIPALPVCQKQTMFQYTTKARTGANKDIRDSQTHSKNLSRAHYGSTQSTSSAAQQANYISQ